MRSNGPYRKAASKNFNPIDQKTGKRKLLAYRDEEAEQMIEVKKLAVRQKSIQDMTEEEKELYR